MATARARAFPDTSDHTATIVPMLAVLHEAISGLRGKDWDVVLVADDHPGSLEFVQIVLEQSGHTVCEAADGEEALRCADLIQPDLIILDLDMPKMDGYGTLRELRKNPRFSRTPIIALTANVMDGDRDRAIEAGFSAFIAKPVGVAELQREVARLLSVRADESLTQAEAMVA